MISERDFERLSAYLDNQLPPAEKSALEAQLARQPELKEALTDLRRQVRAMRDLPRLKPPRNFTLTPQQARQARGTSLLAALFPALRLATSLSAAAFAVVLGLAVLSPAAAPQPQVAVVLQTKSVAGPDSAAQSTTTEQLPALVPQEGTPGAPEIMSGAAADQTTEALTAAPTDEGFSLSGAITETAQFNTEAATSAPSAELEAATPEAGTRNALPSAPPSAAGGAEPDMSAEAQAEPAPPSGLTPLQTWAVGLGALTAVFALLTWFARRR